MIHANDISESGASVYIEMSNEAGDQFVVSMLRNMMGIVGSGVTDVSKRAEENGMNPAMLSELQEHFEILDALEKVIIFYGGTPYHAWR